MMTRSARPEWAGKMLENLDMDAIAENIKHFEQDDRWLQENIGLFRKDFPGMFIAVRNKKLVGAGKTLQEAQNKARSAGIDPARCVIRLVLAEDYEWIL